MLRVLSTSFPTPKAPRGTRPRRGGKSHCPSRRERAELYKGRTELDLCVCVCACAEGAGGEVGTDP